MRIQAVLLVALVGCSTASTDGVDRAGWSALPNAYATHFAHEVRGEDRRLVVFGREGRADTAIVLVLKGQARGMERMIPADLERIAVLSTTHLPFFGALDAVDRVVGIAYSAEVRNVAIKEALSRGKIQEIARADGLDRERLLAVDPQVVFDHPFGLSTGQRASLANAIPVAEYLEEHPLGRAEWIRFFGILLHREERADSLFKAIEHRYSFLCSLKAHLPDPPDVLFGSHWNGAWFAPPGNSYMARLIADAGGRYVFADSIASSNITLPLERMLVMADTVDHVGVVLAKSGVVSSMDLAGDPRLEHLPSIRSGGFVGNSARSDLFGQAILEPDLVLRDLRCIFHRPTCTGQEARYFQVIGQ